MAFCRVAESFRALAVMAFCRMAFGDTAEWHCARRGSCENNQVYSVLLRRALL
jgi:hypothetical protein